MANYTDNATAREQTAGAVILNISNAFARVWDNGLLLKAQKFNYPPAMRL